jgi:hypothetical protein
MSTIESDKKKKQRKKNLDAWRMLMQFGELQENAARSMPSHTPSEPERSPVPSRARQERDASEQRLQLIKSRLRDGKTRAQSLWASYNDERAIER